TGASKLVSSGRITSSPQGYHNKEVRAVAWSPNNLLLASASLDATIRIWSRSRYASRYRFREIATNQKGSWSVAWSPDGKSIATGGEDGTVKIWQASPEFERKVVSLNGRPGLLEVAPDGKRLMLDAWPLTAEELADLARQRSARSLTKEECMTYLQTSSCP